MTSGFVEIAKELFCFLEGEYDFSVVSSSEESWGGQVRYISANHTVGIRLVYEFSSAFVFIFVYRLVAGEMLDNELPITDDSQIHCIDFNDTLSESLKMRPAWEYGEDSEYYNPTLGLRNFVQEFATRLRAHGQALLGGNFGQFAAVQTIIKARAKQLNSRTQ